jgi:uncharacterized iron-regulated membrane protein
MSQSRLITAACVLLLVAGAALAATTWLAATPPPGLAPQGNPVMKAAAEQSDAIKPVARPTTPSTAQSPASASGQRVFIDPATGKLREPEPGEIAALQPAARRSLRAAVAPQEIVGPGGAIGIAVPEEAMSYSVATVNPDGTVSTVCVTGKAKAEGIVKSPAKAKKTAKQEEHDNDR